MVASIHELSPEIFLEILEYLRWDENSQPDRRGLRQYSLVCRSWAHMCQKELFRRVVLTSRKSLILFQAALFPKTKEVDSLRSSVRYLDVTVTSASGIEPADLAQCLRMCPSLHELSLSYSGDHLPKLFNVFPPIKALRLEWSSQTVDVRHFLSQCPSSLEFLDIRDNGAQCNVSCEVSSSHRVLPSFKLFELRWQTYSSDSPTLHWILSNSRHSLRVLSILSTPKDIQTWRTLTQIHGPRLRSLRIMKLHDENDAIESSEALRLCNKLEEFAYGAAEELHPALLEALPSTLEHLRVSLLVKSQAFEAFVRRQGRLRLVSCTYRHVMLLKDEVRKIVDDSLLKKGVALRCRGFSFGGPKAEVEPLIRPKRFPRELS